MRLTSFKFFKIFVGLAFVLIFLGGCAPSSKFSSKYMATSVPGAPNDRIMLDSVVANKINLLSSSVDAGDYFINTARRPQIHWFDKDKIRVDVDQLDSFVVDSENGKTQQINNSLMKQITKKFKTDNQVNADINLAFNMPFPPKYYGTIKNLKTNETVEIAGMFYRYKVSRFEKEKLGKTVLGNIRVSPTDNLVLVGDVVYSFKGESPEDLTFLFPYIDLTISPDWQKLAFLKEADMGDGKAYFIDFYNLSGAR